MNILVWLAVGAGFGWLASILMKTSDQQGMLLNAGVGVVGAMLGGQVISPLVGAGMLNPSDFSVPALLVALAGAATLLGVDHLVRRGLVP